MIRLHTIFVSILGLTAAGAGASASPVLLGVALNMNAEPAAVYFSDANRVSVTTPKAANPVATVVSVFRGTLGSLATLPITTAGNYAMGNFEIPARLNQTEAPLVPANAFAELPAIEFAADLARIDLQQFSANAQYGIAVSLPNEAQSQLEGDDESESGTLTLRSPRMAGADQRTSSVQVVATPLEYADVELAFYDDRSNGRANAFYPVAGAVVQLVGTQFAGNTNVQGRVSLYDLPKPGRYFITSTDESGAYVPGVFQLSVARGREMKGTRRYLMMRRRLLETYAQIVGSAITENSASICITAFDGSSSKPISGARVSLDVGGEGPYYFNQFGLIDRSRQSTGANGRACFFGVEPGAVSLSLFDGQELLGSAVVAALPGFHSEDEVDLEVGQRIAVSLVAGATAYEELSDDTLPRLRNGTVIEHADVFLFGHESAMEFDERFGSASKQDGVLFHQNRAHGVAINGDFETSLLSFEQGMSQDQSIAFMLPRGFLEDMAVYANADFDPGLGSVLVLHDFHQKHQSAQLEAVLIPLHGGESISGWVYNEQDAFKAVFFNLSPGLYQLLIKTRDGYWVAADTTPVYNETVSILKTGSPRRATR